MTRPDAGNRLTRTMAEELVASLSDVRKDGQVTGAVLTGHGDVFCLGGDYRGAGRGTSGRMEFGRAHIDLLDAMARLGKPLVAAVNGDAHAGGFSLVTACDLAFVADDATMGLPESAKGLFPFLALAITRNEIPRKVFFDLAYNARLLGAEEACSLHLANAAVPREDVLSRSIQAVERLRPIDADILMLGRDLYHATSGLGLAAALDAARFALGTALAASDGPSGQARPDGADGR